MDYLYLILVLIIVGLVLCVWYLAKKKKGGEVTGIGQFAQDQADKKQENKQKILGYLEGKEKIANNDVEKLLGVANATAERYLDELEKEGVLRQIGVIGRDVYYEKK